MFGDIGHGFVLFLAGSFLCLFSEPLSRSPGMKAILSLRYIFLLMGFFATFCGIVYNDFMAIPLTIFDSCYTLEYLPSDHGSHHARMKSTPKPDCTYPIGIDPAWYLAKNELAFMNSLKMKISVILGVL